MIDIEKVKKENEKKEKLRSFLGDRAAELLDDEDDN